MSRQNYERGMMTTDLGKSVAEPVAQTEQLDYHSLNNSKKHQ
jgi:hypothetical protein